MTAFLYRNSKGLAVKNHSYSAGATYNFCPTKYYNQKIGGWQEREQHAYFFFGSAIGEAIQAYHERNAEIVSAFEHLWSVHKTNQDLVYGDKEGSWEDLNETGKEMVQRFIC